jgi:L-lactate dehydrogenase (cytochrome)
MKSCWTIINGRVYDFTNFINRHPGGSSVILNAAGKDGAQAFSKFLQELFGI